MSGQPCTLVCVLMRDRYGGRHGTGEGPMTAEGDAITLALKVKWGGGKELMTAGLEAGNDREADPPPALEGAQSTLNLQVMV